MSNNSRLKGGVGTRQGWFIRMWVSLEVLLDVAVVHPLRDHNQFRSVHGCANQGEDVGV